MIPVEPTSVQKILFAGTGGPTFRCQIMVPFTGSSAYTLLELVAIMIIGPLGPPSM